MRNEDRQQFAVILKDVMAFYKQDVSSFALSVWWQACQNYDIEQVRKAMTAHAMDADRGQFAPKPADIVRQLGGTATDRSLVAWGKVMGAMQSVGAYADVVFDDPAIHAVVEDLGGWPKLCRGETKDLSYLQHRFCETHRAYAGRGDFAYPRRLMGDRAPDDAYTTRGLPPPAAAFVGDPVAARQVFAAGVIGGKTAVQSGLVGDKLAELRLARSV
jgi:hypothetical protein